MDMIDDRDTLLGTGVRKSQLCEMLSPERCNSHDVGAINDTLLVLPSVLPLILAL